MIEENKVQDLIQAVLGSIARPQIEDFDNIISSADKEKDIVIFYLKYIKYTENDSEDLSMQNQYIRGIVMPFAIEWLAKVRYTKTGQPLLEAPYGDIADQRERVFKSSASDLFSVSLPTLDLAQNTLGERVLLDLFSLYNLNLTDALDNLIDVFTNVFVNVSQFDVKNTNIMKSVNNFFGQFATNVTSYFRADNKAAMKAPPPIANVEISDDVCLKNQELLKKLSDWYEEVSQTQIDGVPLTIYGKMPEDLEQDKNELLVQINDKSTAVTENLEKCSNPNLYSQTKDRTAVIEADIDTKLAPRIKDFTLSHFHVQSQQTIIKAQNEISQVIAERMRDLVSNESRDSYNLIQKQLLLKSKIKAIRLPQKSGDENQALKELNTCLDEHKEIMAQYDSTMRKNADAFGLKMMKNSLPDLHPATLQEEEPVFEARSVMGNNMENLPDNTLVQSLQKIEQQSEQEFIQIDNKLSDLKNALQSVYNENLTHACAKIEGLMNDAKIQLDDTIKANVDLRNFLDRKIDRMQIALDTQISTAIAKEHVILEGVLGFLKTSLTESLGQVKEQANFLLQKLDTAKTEMSQEINDKMLRLVKSVEAQFYQQKANFGFSLKDSVHKQVLIIIDRINTQQPIADYVTRLAKMSELWRVILLVLAKRRQINIDEDVITNVHTDLDKRVHSVLELAKQYDLDTKSVDTNPIMQQLIEIGGIVEKQAQPVSVLEQLLIAGKENLFH